jgi:hypothetical protein
MSSIATSSALLLALACIVAEPAPDEPFPGVRVDKESRAVEFDGFVPIDAHSDETPHVYLELFVCSPDTREHESLVVTSVRPSHIHAALLLVGLQPGKPGSWTVNGDEPVYIAPEGDRVTVEFAWKDKDGVARVDPAASWVRHVETGEAFPTDAFVFAGSRFVTRAGAEVYDADGAGTIIGLATFGSELIAWPRVISHESAVETPVWIADRAHAPPSGTAVTVRIRPVDAE